MLWQNLHQLKSSTQKILKGSTIDNGLRSSIKTAIENRSVNKAAARGDIFNYGTAIYVHHVVVGELVVTRKHIIY